MNKYLMKNSSLSNSLRGLDLIQELERDYEVGVELFIKHKISALDYFNFLDNNKDINQDVIKNRLNDTYYFLTLDRDIRGE
jgi:hypothetical protein